MGIKLNRSSLRSDKVFSTLKTKALHLSTLRALTRLSINYLHPSKKNNSRAHISAPRLTISLFHHYLFSFLSWHAQRLRFLNLSASKAFLCASAVLSGSPSSLQPGPMQGSKSCVCRQGTLGSSWAFSILCLIRRPLSQVDELQADHGDQFE